jgi:hypothetical protein
MQNVHSLPHELSAVRINPSQAIYLKYMVVFKPLVFCASARAEAHLHCILHEKSFIYISASKYLNFKNVTIIFK